MENNYNNLLTLFNCIISLINALTLVILIRKVNNTKKNFLAGQGVNFTTPKYCTNNEKEEIVLHAPMITKTKHTELFINKATEERLVKEFERAKVDQFFLKKGISLKDLAKLLNTNQRYVSYIINKLTGMDFYHFVQQARIEYLIHAIEQNPDLLNVKFAVLAEELGFSSVNKLSSVFKSVKGVTPSEYFKRLRTAN